MAAKATSEESANDKLQDARKRNLDLAIAQIVAGTNSVRGIMPAGIQAPIQLLSPILPEAAAETLRLRLIPTIDDLRQVRAAVSQVWVDGQALRTYRHAPNTGSRKSWAAGDATSRAVRLALISQTGEMGYPSVLSARGWGFYDVLFKGKPFKFQRPFGSYVMAREVRDAGYRAEVAFAETGTLPYLTRKHGPAEVANRETRPTPSSRCNSASASLVILALTK